ncbi:general secretion pathway protein GspB [Simiduia sp. 21SJ11W-1]|uniref:general secretion pathway protein GspB n=1 Tax=Simiduia sp. 21SJ11W-1 TaxID=2909669 RepID=UPI00209C9F8B|nr:general secretion pathway protein GspB [Simiduia sp. 21SJ11W-1]UTA47762.1 general secretion pathway protein GspB [Simiduia sp. 21SJ11W-1]
MSYILDALNKSEQERREQQQVPSLHAIHQPEKRTTARPHTLWLLLGAIALCAAILAASWWLLGERPGKPAKQPASPQVTQENTLAAAIQASITQPEQAPQPLQATSEQEALPAALQSTPPQNTRPQRPKTAPELQPQANSDAVVSLYTNPQVEPKTSPKAEPRTVNNLPPAVASQAQAALAVQQVLPISALPIATQQRLPEMYYSAHIYSNEEGKGFAIINDRSRYKGDVIGPGLFVQEVREEGVVLNFEGQAFLLNALTDWP